MQMHMKKAIMSRLTSNRSPRNSSFNPLSELGIQFPFNNITQAQKFCPKEHRDTIYLEDDGKTFSSTFIDSDK
jgi:hypothetical protein